MRVQFHPGNIHFDVSRFLQGDKTFQNFQGLKDISHWDPRQLAQLAHLFRDN